MSAAARYVASVERAPNGKLDHRWLRQVAVDALA